MATNPVQLENNVAANVDDHEQIISKLIKEKKSLEKEFTDILKFILKDMKKQEILISQFDENLIENSRKESAYENKYKELFNGIESVKKQNIEDKKRISLQEGSLKEAKKQITVLETENKKAKKQITALETYNAEAKKQITALETYNAEAKKQITALKAYNAEAKKQITALEVYNAEAKKQITTLESHNEEAKKQILTLKKQNEEEKKQITALDTQNNEAKKKITVLEKQLAEERKLNKVSEDTVKKLEHRVSSLENSTLGKLTITYWELRKKIFGEKK